MYDLLGVSVVYCLCSRLLDPKRPSSSLTVPCITCTSIVYVLCTRMRIHRCIIIPRRDESVTQHSFRTSRGVAWEINWDTSAIFLNLTWGSARLQYVSSMAGRHPTLGAESQVSFLKAPLALRLASYTSLIRSAVLHSIASCV